MSENNRNIILAIVLSVVVLFGWQYFVSGPQMERAQRQAEIAAQQQQAQQAAQDTSLAHPNAAAGTSTAATPGAAPDSATAKTFEDRATAIAASQRVRIDTHDLAGSINLTGARLDDLELKNYRETVDPKSPIIALLNPAGAAGAYFVEQGWVPQPGASVKVPDAQTVWTLEGDANATLTETTPVTLSWDNGEGLTFKRTFAVD